MRKAARPVKEISSEDRFVNMRELVFRLGRSRVDIYKQARIDPDFLELVKSGGKTGALDSEIRRYLASLPKLKLATKEAVV